MENQDFPIVGQRDERVREEPALPEPHAPARRSFLGALIGVGAAGVSALLAVPLARFALYPVLAKTSEVSWSDLGALAEFSSITTPIRRTLQIEQRDGWRKIVSEKAVYIVKGANGPRVLSSVCPHLGCTVAWHESRGKFISPCHNGIFAPDGSLISGPPRRAMDELPVKVEKGRLFVQYRYFRSLVATKEIVA